jgi:methionine transaminase
LDLISKLPSTGTSIFTVMSALATASKAINLGQGFPDFPMTEGLPELVCRAMNDGFNQYAPMEGLPALRESIAAKIFSLYGREISPADQITITPGGTCAIYTALTTVLRAGDEVIVFEPAYDSYVPNILVNGATPVLIPLEYPSYCIDWEKVRAKISPRTRMIMLNSPHNPTGSVLTDTDIAALRSLVQDTGILILSDEVYEHLIFDGLPHQSMLRYPDLFSRSFVCFSFGKVYHCTGWKIGYCVSPAALMKEFRKVHQFNCFSTHTPSQVALAGFIRDKGSYEGLPAFMQAKRDYFQSLMEKTKFKALPSHGSYFQLYSYDSISEEPDALFAKRITTELGVASIPVSAFYQSFKDDKVLRFCFAKKNETLEEAVGRLEKL